MNALAKRLIPGWIATVFERPIPRRLGSLAPVLHEVVEKLEAVKPAARARTEIRCEVPPMTPLPPPQPVSGRKRNTVLMKLLGGHPMAVKSVQLATGWLLAGMDTPPVVPPPPAPDPYAGTRAIKRRMLAAQTAPGDTRKAITKAARQPAPVAERPALPPPQKPVKPLLAVTAPTPAATPRRTAKPTRRRSGGKRKAGNGEVTPKMQPRLAAAAWLAQRLAGGPVAYAAIKAEAEAAGHRPRTLDRAADVIDVESVEIGGGKTEWRMRKAPG